VCGVCLPRTLASSGAGEDFSHGARQQELVFGYGVAVSFAFCKKYKHLRVFDSYHYHIIIIMNDYCVL
jgi:hypothetical protein